MIGQEYINQLQEENQQLEKDIIENFLHRMESRISPKFDQGLSAGIDFLIIALEEVQNAN